ncbi:quinone oxidoreductase family protein [Phenylobacterium montanum]|uniref:Quinone oxidoreductase n=1 Tax=Phenylobacterium montanum TaxID=2823693 RepID=A0A975FX96_9CAUL|nr:quinone oxidoreductase [Caulobacter sp. S6]QUD86649.1 quinone oxidoreductase [Caulobacter sp. S6]
MLAIQASRPGGPEVLEAIDLAESAPGPGQILVRHKAIGINFIDTYHRSGLYPIKYPAVLGQEASGVVEAVGEGVTRFKVGDRAAYGTGPLGAYAEAHLVPADRAVKIPEAVSFETAAAIMLKGMTVEFLIRRCHTVLSGETIVVHAAAGGVGTLMTQWAATLGAHVIGTVGSAAKAELAKAHGCQHVILYREEDVAARVREITGGKGVPVVYDGVGAATFEASLASLGRRGMLVSFGNASGPAPAIEPARLARGGSLFLTRPTLFDYVATTPELDASAAAVFEVVASGQVKVEIGQTFSLKDARRAHEALESRETSGASLLLP